MASEQLEQIVQMFRAAPRVERPFPEMRADLEQMVGGAPVPDGVACDPVRAAGVACEWITAEGADPRKVVLYLHGGGYVMGSVNTHRSHVGRLSTLTGARALAVGYRLAPEHRFPAAVDDATGVYRWLLAAGIPAASIAIAGDSAGGGLTVATLLALRDAGDPLPAGAVCISPWSDLTCNSASMTTRAALDPMVQRESLLRMAGAYLGDASPTLPLASPLHADLRGLPPLLIHVGTSETLFDDARILAERARAAGVEVTYEAWDDMIHVWHMFAPFLPEAERAMATVGSFVRQLFLPIPGTMG